MLHVRVVGPAMARGLCATERVAAGDVLFAVTGITTAMPSRYSIQVGDAEHIDLSPGTPVDEMLVRHPWRFLNHSCSPNAAYRHRTFVALRPIESGESVTYDYDTTEFDMAEPFDCTCGSDACRERVSGFAHLSPMAQEALRPLLADHLRRRLDSALPLA